jgi:hypothetical protein
MLAEWEAARSARNFHASRQSKGSIEAMVAGLKMDWLKEILLIYHMNEFMGRSDFLTSPHNLANVSSKSGTNFFGYST